MFMKSNSTKNVVSVPCPICDVDDSSTRSRQWIECENCSVWFQGRCVKLTKRQIEAMDEPWFGPCCSSSSAAANQQKPESFSFNREGAVIKRVPKASRIQTSNRDSSKSSDGK